MRLVVVSLLLCSLVSCYSESVDDHKVISFDDNAEAIFYPSIFITIPGVGAGSGTIIGNKLDGNKYINYVLTAKHVVDKAKTSNEILIKVFDFKGNSTEFKAKLVSKAGSLDAALLSFESDRVMSVAKVSDQPLEMFDNIRCISCQEGYYPVFTKGYVMLPFNVLYEHDESYAMAHIDISFGSSGGGVYRESDNKLAAIICYLVGDSLNAPMHYYCGILKVSEIKKWAESAKLGYCFEKQIQGGNGYVTGPGQRSK